eukprot:gene13149-17728_t
MLDINLLRKDLPTAIARLESRKSPQAFLNVEVFIALEQERKTIQSRTEELQNLRNTRSRLALGAEYSQIDSHLAELRPSEQRVARFVLGRPTVMVEMSIADLAERADVS